MADTFDPYHKWLGIPPEEQPSHHYRLLGLRLYEDDADAINHAADRAMAHVRSFQAGRFSLQSQQLLNELSAARVCLLDPDEKAAYDRELRVKTAAKAAPRDAPEDAGVAGLGRVAVGGAVLRTKVQAQRARRQQTALLLAAVLALGFGVGAVALVWALMLPGTPEAASGSKRSGARRKPDAPHSRPLAPEEHVPMAVDDFAETVEGSPAVIDVVANDTDPLPGDKLRITSAGGMQHGTVALKDGKLHYAPHPGFYGDDQIQYTVSDSAGNQAFATVSVTVRGINRALNRPVTASSIESRQTGGNQDGHVPENAVDGQTWSRWASQYSEPNWICVDLGCRHAISGARILWERAHAAAYEVQVSDDQEEWATIYTTEECDGDYDEIRNLRGLGRYLRVYCTARATKWGFSVYELEVFGRPTPAK